MAEPCVPWRITVVWSYPSRPALVREGHHRTFTILECVHALDSMYVKRTIVCVSGSVESTHLLRDVRVRTEPQYVVVARSSVSCRRFQRGAHGIDACGACCLVELCRFGESYEIPPVLERRGFFWLLLFLEGA